jgi:hypothetical protein
MGITLRSAMNQTGLARIAADGARMARGKGALIDAAQQHKDAVARYDTLLSFARKTQPPIGLTKVLRERRAALANPTVSTAIEAAARHGLFADARDANPPKTVMDSRTRLRHAVSPNSSVELHALAVRAVSAVEDQAEQTRLAVERAEKAERGQRRWQWITLAATVVMGVLASPIVLKLFGL